MLKRLTDYVEKVFVLNLFKHLYLNLLVAGLDFL